MRLIDADKLKYHKVYSNERHEKVVPVSYIDWMPTVDAVPITRCKDCKWYDTEYHCKLNGYGCGRSPDWFCADGKKEEEDTEDGN